MWVEARWTNATARAEGVTDLGIGGAVRRYFLTVFPLTVAISFGVGLALAAIWPEVREGFLLSGVYLGLVLGEFGIFIAGLVYGTKKVGPLVQPRRTGVTVGLASGEAKHVQRQVLGREPTYHEQLPVLRAAAVQLREGLARQLLTMPGLLILFCGQAVSHGIV
ncbi:hypothetical protein IWX62_000879 [Arthrobacter sp. CAN_A1]